MTDLCHPDIVSPNGGRGADVQTSDARRPRAAVPGRVAAGASDGGDAPLRYMPCECGRDVSQCPHRRAAHGSTGALHPPAVLRRRSARVDRGGVADRPHVFLDAGHWYVVYPDPRYPVAIRRERLEALDVAAQWFVVTRPPRQPWPLVNRAALRAEVERRAALMRGSAT